MRAGARKRLTRSFDALLAVAAGLTITAPHWPWYVATQTPPGGNPIAPEGTAAGLPAHPTLWAVTGLAVARFPGFPGTPFLPSPKDQCQDQDQRQDQERAGGSAGKQNPPPGHRRPKDGAER
ncbi:MAG TPA: hypothetical protein VGD91_14470 [Trebonia sp.]